ncbi:SPW repeat domain-containing protein [Saccharothrix deserti]|uniref:SPW repeat domain-containing protein n=1 Tax=Saccharothrix deserti TaxID=2593674 RepID=UPI00131BFAB9|nr:SPW repeat protein [Saccharothrix deserti]
MGGTTGRVAIGARLSAIAFVLGLWLVVSPFALGYGIVGNWLTGHSNEVVTGIVVVVAGLIGAMAPADARWAGPVTAAAGVWLAAAPWSIGYRDHVDPTAATVNDLAVGSSIAVLGMVAAVVTRR